MKKSILFGKAGRVAALILAAFFLCGGVWAEAASGGKNIPDIWKVPGSPVSSFNQSNLFSGSYWNKSVPSGAAVSFSTSKSLLQITGSGPSGKSWYVKTSNYSTGSFSCPDGSILRLKISARRTSGKGSLCLAISGLVNGEKANDRAGITKSIDSTEFAEYKAWLLKDDSNDSFYLRFIGNGDGKYEINSINLDVIDGSILKKETVWQNEEVFKDGHFSGPMEVRPETKWGRGLSAVKLTTGGQLLTWRFLQQDLPQTCFTVSRVRGGIEKLLTSSPVENSTDFLDNSGSAEDEYILRTYADSSLKELLGTDKISGASKEYFSIVLDEGEQVARGGFAAADLNGDGENEYVIKTSVEGNIDPAENCGWHPGKRPFIFKAYDHFGKPLWQKNLGWNIEGGIWYSPFICADLDGDGKAEIIAKTGEDTEAGGKDYRGADGRVQSGPQYLSVLDGMTGKEICRTDWVGWDAYENESYEHSVRNQIALAYLDGKTPCVVMLSGTYAHQEVRTFYFERESAGAAPGAELTPGAGRLVPVWAYNNRFLGAKFQGQGAHWTDCFDFDEDGRDEILIGSVMLDDNGEVLWTTGRGHPDSVYYGEIDPDHAGKEILYTYETKQKDGGFLLVDLKGKEIWKFNEATDHIHSQALCADVDPKIPGREFYGMNSAPGHVKTERKWYFAGNGRLLLSGPEISEKWGWAPEVGYVTEKPYETMYRLNEVQTATGFKTLGSIILTADIEGDWREEVVTAHHNELRIYSTVNVSKNRRPTLRQDRFYNSVVTNDSSGYAQHPELPDGMKF